MTAVRILNSDLLGFASINGATVGSLSMKAVVQFAQKGIVPYVSALRFNENHRRTSTQKLACSILHVPEM